MKLSIGKKLGLGFAIVLALMVMSAALTYLKTNAIREKQDRAFTETLASHWERWRIPSKPCCKRARKIWIRECVH